MNLKNNSQFYRNIRNYLINNDDGKRFFGNAMYAVRHQHYQFSSIRELFYDLVKQNNVVEYQDSIERFKAESVNRRYREGLMRTEILGGPELQPFLNEPDLTGKNVYSVTSLRALIDIMSLEDRRRLDLPASAEGDVVDPEAMSLRLDILGPDKCHFSLNASKGLGRFVFWFATQECIDAARAEHEAGRLGSSGPSLSFVELLRSRHGLGHFKKGTWLVLLNVPGSAIQKAGHYRPIFLDGRVGPDCWFMACSSKSSTDNGNWGQTCRLAGLDGSGSPYDGALERVAIQPRREHFDDEPIRFEVLGPCEQKFGDDRAMKFLSDDIWRRRKA